MTAQPAEDDEPGGLDTDRSGLPAAIARALADERSAAAAAMQEATLDDLLRRGGDVARAGVDALLAVAAPDDAARMRAHLGLPKPAGHPRQTTDELADDWQSGGYPYKYRMLRKDYERQKFQDRKSTRLNSSHG